MSLSGKYRLRVLSPAGTAWHFDLSETFSQKLVFKVHSTPAGTSISAHGVGDQQTQVFRIVGDAQTKAGIILSGDFRDQGSVVFTLLPVGPGAHARHPVSQTKDPGAVTGPIVFGQRTPGQYVLLVRTTGLWSLSVADS